LNQDGVHQAGEPGIPGVPITLNPTVVTALSLVSYHAITDQDGFYQMLSVVPGRYILTVIPPPGAIPTTPVEVTVDVGANTTVSINIGFYVLPYRRYFPLVWR